MLRVYSGTLLEVSSGQGNQHLSNGFGTGSKTETGKLCVAFCALTSQTVLSQDIAREFPILGKRQTVLLNLWAEPSLPPVLSGLRMLGIKSSSASKFTIDFS